MSELGGQVLAVDFSEGMLERARAHGGDVEYRYTDAMDEEALLALGEPTSFDAVVSNMAMMDMEAIEPMAAAFPPAPEADRPLRLLDAASRLQLGRRRPTVELDVEGGDG